jgi:hypothetical protein
MTRLHLKLLIWYGGLFFFFSRLFFLISNFIYVFIYDRMITRVMMMNTKRN